MINIITSSSTSAELFVYGHTHIYAATPTVHFYYVPVTTITTHMSMHR